jgi:hypothetical protein
MTQFRQIVTPDTFYSNLETATMRKLAALLAVGCIAGSVVAVPSLASADTPGCVSRAEFYSIKRGMSPAKVGRIFDTRGSVIYDEWDEVVTDNGDGSFTVTSYQDVVRSYKKCSGYERGRGRVGVRFDDRNAVRSLMLTGKVRNFPRDLIPY